MLHNYTIRPLSRRHGYKHLKDLLSLTWVKEVMRILISVLEGTCIKEHALGSSLMVYSSLRAVLEGTILCLQLYLIITWQCIMEVK